MSDWQIGDVALCIESGERTRKGSTYTVSAIQLPGESSFGSTNRWPDPVLRFFELEPFPATKWCDANRFRKIRPDEHEDCEPEFVTLLESFKPKVPAETIKSEGN